jgi:hypothetical protein
MNFILQRENFSVLQTGKITKREPLKEEKEPSLTASGTKKTKINLKYTQNFSFRATHKPCKHCKTHLLTMFMEIMAEIWDRDVSRERGRLILRVDTPTCTFRPLTTITNSHIIQMCNVAHYTKEKPMHKASKTWKLRGGGGGMVINITIFRNT